MEKIDKTDVFQSNLMQHEVVLPVSYLYNKTHISNIYASLSVVRTITGIKNDQWIKCNCTNNRYQLPGKC